MKGLRRIDRYVATEILGPFAMALAFLFILLFAMQMLRGIEVLFGSGVHLPDLARIALYQAPHFLVMAMPVSLLFAVVLAMGRLSEDREVLALAASGVPARRLLVAPIGIGVVVGLVGVFLATGPDPNGLSALKFHVNELIKRNMAGDVKPGVFYDALTDLTLYAQGVSPKTHRFTNVMLTDERDPEASMLVLAREGKVDPAGGGDLLKLLLHDGEIHRASNAADANDYAVVTFAKATLNIGVAGDLLRKNRFGGARDELTSAELADSMRRARAEGRIGDALGLEVARNRRLAAPLAAIVFALCAVPLAMGRRGSARALGALATLGAYIGYYVLSRAGDVMAEQGRISPLLAAHGANLVFLALGLLLMHRATRAEA